jgi:hypothetical protein
MILASREQKYRARSSRAARICARQTTAGDTALRRVMRRMSIHPQAIWDFAASFERGSATINQPLKSMEAVMKVRRKFWLSLLAGSVAVVAASSQAPAQQQKPNILFIMGDDIGWMQPRRKPPTSTASGRKAPSSGAVRFFCSDAPQIGAFIWSIRASA